MSTQSLFLFSMGMNMCYEYKNRPNGTLSKHDALAFPQHGVDVVPNGVDEF